MYCIYAARHGKHRWGDKTPTYLSWMPAIAEVLPEAAFIHLIRDGRDAALSVRGLWFGPPDLDRAAHHWSEQIAIGREAAPGLERYLEVRYEELVLSPRSVLQRVCEFLELSWSERMLDYHRQAGRRLAEISRPLPGDSGAAPVSAAQRIAIHSLASSPPDSTRIGRWREEMTLSEQRRFLAIAGPLLADLGYAPE